MKIEPKIRGFICTTAHPDGAYQHTLEQVNIVKANPPINGAKRVLVIGASTGYGLASRIAATYAMQAKTIGVFYEKPAEGKRTASTGWYHSAAFEKLAHADGHYAKSINGDAFSNEIKHATAALIKQDLGQIDLVIYSLASPRRVHPITGQVFNSVLKPIGDTFTGKTVDVFRGEIKPVSIDPASPEEIESTVAVMGGEDWEMWVDYLLQQGLLSEGCQTIAYSYLGPSLTHAIYTNGTIGRAKAHLKQTADVLNKKLQTLQGHAYVSVNKAVVTQASAAIPVVPLYISILFKIMKEKNIHEDCIEQIYRLYEKLYSSQPLQLDKEGYIRIDDWEMREDVQAEVARLWPQVNTENIEKLTDLAGYREEFYRLFGFNIQGVDYEREVNPDVSIDSIKN